jgi:cell division septum initiation protein DivIVA
MVRRNGGDAVGNSGGPVSRPNLTGDLDEMLGVRPLFKNRLHGYDPLEVDNYAAWAESELATLRRQVDHLLVRFGNCSAELEISRRLLADAPRGKEVFPVSDRVQEMLHLASEEAASLTEMGAEEAERIIAEARTEADARLRKAHQIKEMAVTAADELQEQARRVRAEADAHLEQARRDAAELRRAAAVERERLAAEAAQERDRLNAVAAQERDRLAVAAAARLAGVQAEVDDLRRQRDQARQSLRGLTDRIGEALQAVAATGPDDMRSTNVAVEGMGHQPVPADDVRVLIGRPSPVPS